MPYNRLFSYGDIFRISRAPTKIRTANIFWHNNRFNVTILSCTKKYLNGYSSYENYLLYMYSNLKIISNITIIIVNKAQVMSYIRKYY